MKPSTVRILMLGDIPIAAFTDSDRANKMVRRLRGKTKRTPWAYSIIVDADEDAIYQDLVKGKVEQP